MNGPPSRPQIGDADWRAAWELALDRLELDVERAEQLLASAAHFAIPPWEPPPVRGPLPDDLVPRARLLHERQLATARDIAMAAAATRRQVALTAKVVQTMPPEVPVYLDITA